MRQFPRGVEVTQSVVFCYSRLLGRDELYILPVCVAAGTECVQWVGFPEVDLFLCDPESETVNHSVTSNSF